ncbi:hypothetical protein SBRCBS47491_007727 [Sporothrix bragantina]|uniref:N-acetyltransferase domain-containing protein n=1 Tax=Sporothrix bragantina TaxID=671064 RepID=A0ABP0CFI1_9PEZI
MKVNENIAVATPGVLLVPYDRRHVPTYHAWMEDEAVRAATASERLTLDEEYENQESWRESGDKLTFIVCRAREGDSSSDTIVAGVDDAPSRMVGDINFFLTPFEEEDGTESGFAGEVDVMIAGLEDRGKGYGRAAVTAFLHYILQRQREAILAEASSASSFKSMVLRQLVVKIQATNAASIGLFKSLGFVQNGDVNYFGEVELVRTDLTVDAPQGYTEHIYQRDVAADRS